MRAEGARRVPVALPVPRATAEVVGIKAQRAAPEKPVEREAREIQAPMEMSGGFESYWKQS